MYQINTLEELEAARLLKRAVIVPQSHAFRKHQPAAWMINLPGPILLRLFRQGMYLYKRRK